MDFWSKFFEKTLLTPVTSSSVLRLLELGMPKVWTWNEFISGPSTNEPYFGDSKEFKCPHHTLALTLSRTVMSDLIKNDPPASVPSLNDVSSVHMPPQTEEEKAIIAKWNAGGCTDAALCGLPFPIGDGPVVQKHSQTEEEKAVIAQWNAGNDSVREFMSRQAVPDTPIEVPPQTEEEKAIIAQWNAGHYCEGIVHNKDGLTDAAAEGLAAYVRTAQPPPGLPVLRGTRGWNHTASGRSYIWSVIFGGRVTVYFNDGRRDREFSGGFGGIAAAWGWTWGTVHYDDIRQLNRDSSAMWVGTAGPFMSVTSKGVPYPEQSMRMQYLGGGLPALGALIGLGEFN
ncbi:hypothetical protein Hypma_003911 [Hypsizygus marmoreus]|uniref:Uncharacterized protein n=1 Tax=Hypsizygus marmoreus TaxID=39966 RepID=A0A369K0I1_HYPMA|nr:hypothetical protein Hypma_003911 [Hypsizygus marmoreus]